MFSRPPRQLRNRNVARLVKGNRTVKFHDLVECVDVDQHYHEKLNLESERAIFPHHRIRRILMLCLMRNGSCCMIPLPHEL